MKLRFLLVLLMILGLNISASIANADYRNVDIVANFTDGTGTTAVDAFEGTAGGGWANAWTPLEYYATATFTVEDTNPLYVDSGNYLSITSADPYDKGLAGGGRATAVRNYTDIYDGIDLAQDYSISFSIRIDDMADMDIAKDQFLVFEGATEATNASSSSFFIIKATGNATDPTIFQQWTVSDGDNAGGNTPIDTDLTLAQGSIYEFSLAVHPDPDGNGTLDGNGTYDVAITNITTSESFSATDLGWRAAGTTLGGYLHFTTMVAGATDDVGAMSVDNIAISQYQEYTPPGGVNPVVARFDQGVSTEEVDAFTGMAGNGWRTAWEERTYHGTSSATTTVDNTSELHTGSGNYLAVSVTNTDAEDFMTYGVARNYKTLPGDPSMNYTDDHSVQFSIRIDEADIGSSYFDVMTDVNDQYLITGSSDDNGNVQGIDTFAIFAQGADGDVGVGTAQQWIFVDGNNDGIKENCSYIASGISLTPGVVYDFTVTYDMDAKTYDVSVTDGTNTVTEMGLGWITSDDTIGGYLNFSVGASDNQDTRSFSIDDIVITEINEEEWIPGDANKDGFVDGSDATILANYWQYGVGMTNPDATWEMGDFNEDGVVDGSDATLLASHWQEGTPPSSAVPEPSTVIGLITLLLAGFALARKR